MSAPAIRFQRLGLNLLFRRRDARLQRSSFLVGGARPGKQSTRLVGCERGPRPLPAAQVLPKFLLRVGLTPFRHTLGLSARPVGGVATVRVAFRYRPVLVVDHVLGLASFALRVRLRLPRPWCHTCPEAGPHSPHCFSSFRPREPCARTLQPCPPPLRRGQPSRCTHPERSRISFWSCSRPGGMAAPETLLASLLLAVSSLIPPTEGREVAAGSEPPRACDQPRAGLNRAHQSRDTALRGRVAGEARSRRGYPCANPARFDRTRARKDDGVVGRFSAPSPGRDGALVAALARRNWLPQAGRRALRPMTRIPSPGTRHQVSADVERATRVVGLGRCSTHGRAWLAFAPKTLAVSRRPGGAARLSLPAALGVVPASSEVYKRKGAAPPSFRLVDPRKDDEPCLKPERPKRTRSRRTTMSRWMRSTTALTPRTTHTGTRRTRIRESDRAPSSTQRSRGSTVCAFLAFPAGRTASSRFRMATPDQAPLR